MKYRWAHEIVQKERGKASSHQCIDCGSSAKHWSYNGDDGKEIIDPATGSRYSINADYYEPRCVSCHHKKDNKAANLPQRSGEEHHNAKLTMHQVQAIRTERKLAGTTFMEMATRYGVSKKTISNIINNRRYKESGGAL